MNQDKLLGLLDDIYKHGFGLTDWEIDFVADVLRQDFPITPEQASIIKLIYEGRVMN